MPTIIDLLGIHADFYSFGTSYFSKKSMPKMICEQGNLIALGSSENGLETIVWNERMQQNRSSHDLQIIRQMKALYQHYTHDMITNHLTPNSKK
jgi:hypothetical protein